MAWPAATVTAARPRVGAALADEVARKICRAEPRPEKRSVSVHATTPRPSPSSVARISWGREADPVSRWTAPNRPRGEDFATHTPRFEATAANRPLGSATKRLLEVPASPRTSVCGRPNFPLRVIVRIATELQQAFPAGLSPASTSSVEPLKAEVSTCCVLGTRTGVERVPEAERQTTYPCDWDGLSAFCTLKLTAAAPFAANAMCGGRTSSENGWAKRKGESHPDRAAAGAQMISATSSARAAARARPRRRGAHPQAGD